MSNRLIPFGLRRVSPVLAALALSVACGGARRAMGPGGMRPGGNLEVPGVASQSDDAARPLSAAVDGGADAATTALPASPATPAGADATTAAGPPPAVAASTEPLPPRQDTPADPGFDDPPFTGSARCAMCHDGIVDGEGHDVSIVRSWSATMMANAARDPLWQAKLERELGESPDQAALITDKCTRCHAPMGHETNRLQGQLPTLGAAGVDPQSAHGAAAQDGVSCTVCHQIRNTDLGAASSFDGHFEIGSDRAIFGPFQDVLQMPMQRMVGYTPQYGEQITRSELCATCHNVKTPVLDAHGALSRTAPGEGFAEQAPYTEWQNSAFATISSCADCHMGRTDGVIIAARPPHLNSVRDRFALHGFVGGNALMLGLLDQYRSELGVLASDFAPVQARTQALMRGAAKLSLVSSAVRDGRLELALRVSSETGHKLPTSFPSRRVVLHVTLRDPDGKLLFESGRVQDDGRIAGLASETDLSRVEPHHDVIERESQAQIYECVMQDSEGAITFTLLRAASYRKDNRLLPRGADKARLPPDIAVQGEARDDADFRAGEDIVHYRIAAPTGRYRLQAELLYQTLSGRFASHLFAGSGPAVRWLRAAYAGASHKVVPLAQLDVQL